MSVKNKENTGAWLTHVAYHDALGKYDVRANDKRYGQSYNRWIRSEGGHGRL